MGTGGLPQPQRRRQTGYLLINLYLQTLTSEVVPETPVIGSPALPPTLGLGRAGGHSPTSAPPPHPQLCN